jgi:hypothetical protein
VQTQLPYRGWSIQSIAGTRIRCLDHHIIHQIAQNLFFIGPVEITWMSKVLFGEVLGGKFSRKRQPKTVTDFAIMRC